MRVRKKKNRKKNFVGGIGFLIVALIVFLCFLYLQFSIHNLGYSIQNYENKNAELEDEKARLESMISRIESPANLDRAIQRAELGLQPTKPLNVIQVSF